QYDWVSNLSGQAKFSINNGIIKGFDLQSIVNILKSPGNLFDLTAIQNFFNGRGTTAFSNASGDFTIANGITSTKNLIVETSEAHLKAEGQADLVNWQMRFNG
ncbi:MAG: AsmA-like C-terminal region-containing protein, partial [bacterium]